MAADAGGGRRFLASPRFRITAGATIVVGLVLVATATWSVSTQRRALTDVIDDRVQQQADDITALVSAGTIEEPLAREYDDDGLAQLVAGNGEVVAASPNVAGDAAVAEPPPQGDRQRVSTVDDLPLGDRGAEFRLLSRRVAGPDDTYVLYVAGELDDVNESVAVLTRNLALAFPGVLAVVAAIIWFVTDRALRRVEAAHERQQRFVGDASHELRTPLTSIRSELEVDLAHPDQRDLRATHRSVLDETVRLQRLVDDLLYLARSDARVGEKRRDAVDLDEIVLEEAKAARARRGIDVDTGGVSGAQVVGDGDQLTRVVRNLLDNAERHARSRVVLTLGEDGDRVVLTVTDDGPGIPAEQAGRIFERFARVDEARGRDEGGSGLGLAITHEIVTRHGGTITVDLNHGSGARFRVRLPLGRGSESPPAPRSTRRAPMSPVKPIPDGYPQVSPYLVVDDGAKAIDFYTKVLGAKERMRMPAPGGKVGHAELQIGDSVIMLADAFPDMGYESPRKIGGTPVTISVFVEDVDKTFATALEAGAKELRAVENQFYGDRSGQFEDPFGHRWGVSTHVEDVSPEEMGKRAAKMMEDGG
jgi:signal transduction histidine kinase/uncharacterized glyoxalase superfamily protein PhnB